MPITSPSQTQAQRPSIMARATTNRPPAPAGSHASRCISVVDVGTHTESFQGKTITNRKVKITWELSATRHVFSEEKGEEPFTQTRTYTLSLHAKASLRRDLEAWRGKQFTEDELKGFDLMGILGKPCLISIIHAPKKDQTVGSKISGVSKLPVGMACPPCFGQPIGYSVDQGKDAVYASLHEWLRKDCDGCAEWADGASQYSPEEETEGSAPVAEHDMPF